MTQESWSSELEEEWHLRLCTGQQEQRGPHGMFKVSVNDVCTVERVWHCTVSFVSVKMPSKIIAMYLIFLSMRTGASEAAVISWWEINRTTYINLCPALKPVVETWVSHGQTEAGPDTRPDFGRFGMKPHTEYILDSLLFTAHHTVFLTLRGGGNNLEKKSKFPSKYGLYAALDRCSCCFKVFVSDS